MKAHIGLDGSKLADKYAKLGTEDHPNQISTLTTHKDIRAATRYYVCHKWKEKRKALKKCHMTKLFYDGPNCRVGNVVFRLSRSNVTLFIHATTGHNNLNYISSIIINEYTPLCRFDDEEDETSTPTARSFGNNDARYKETRLTYRTVLDMAKLEVILLAMHTKITKDIVKNRRQ